MKHIFLYDRSKNRFTCFFDDVDYDFVCKYKWSLHKSHGYLYCRRYEIVDGKLKWIFLHNDLLKESDHLNRNGLDNRRCNLRVSDKSKNILNSHKYRREPCRSYLPRGVTEYWYRGILRFKTQLKIGGKGLYLGLFRDVTSASLAYSNKVKELDIYQYQH